MQSDWRLSNQLTYLAKSKLRHARFNKNTDGDHAHCEFCWEKFSECKESEHAGYCTLDGYRWICESCFNDFQQLFQWTVITEVDSSK